MSSPAAPHVCGRHESNGCCLVPRRNRYRRWLNSIRTAQPLARCLTPCLNWTITLFAMFLNVTPISTKTSGLAFGGAQNRLVARSRLLRIHCRFCSHKSYISMGWVSSRILWLSIHVGFVSPKIFKILCILLNYDIIQLM
jgi:hypothetical protein